MKIVVTGSSGFLGSRLVRVLREFESVHVIPVSRARIDEPGSLVVDSYEDIPSADVVVHLAENPDRSVVNRTKNFIAAEVLENILSKKFQRVVYISSAAVYGDMRSIPSKTSDIVFGVDEYTKSKLYCEEIAKQNPSWMVARLCNLYGPGMSASSVLSKILNQLPCNDKVSVWDDSPVRDFVWVDDAANAIAKMAVSNCLGVYNVGSGRAVSIKELIKLAMQITNSEGCNIELTNPSDRTSYNVLDVTETKKDFNWLPETNLEDGLRYLLKHKLEV